MNAAAIILCAGKGTRMQDDSKNKVCFDCAGTPVIRRIIDNMKAGGVSRFVIVVGHQATSVMDTLDGVDGVVYAYQKEQKGTGHAALCGMKALAAIGYKGPVIVSMGDKIVSAKVVAELLQRSSEAKMVVGVQPAEYNPNGGRVLIEDGKPYGIVEMADAAFMSLAGRDKAEYQDILHKIGLNEKKAAKVIKLAETKTPQNSTKLAGKEFTAQDILECKYSNVSFYCFDLDSAIEVIGTIGSNNAQGEIYLTDTVEQFSIKNEIAYYEVPDPLDLLTFSTKPELRDISWHFLKKASEHIAQISNNDMPEAKKQMYLDVLNLFIDKYGDKPALISCAPGRVNLMGRHIDHRGGCINVMAVDREMVFVASPRTDDTVRICNVDASFPDREFAISQTLSLAPHEKWLDYLDATPVREALKASAGDWSNYVKSAVLRLQLESDIPLCGMDMAAGGNIPVAAGLSSSSSIVVAVGQAVIGLNSLNIAKSRFVDLCGEGEWFVGSRGGAGDHAAMICSQQGRITRLGFKPFYIGQSAPFSDKYAIIVADSMQKAKKSEGSKDKFNAKVASYEFALMMLNKYFPDEQLKEFRDIAAIRPFSKIYKMLKFLPEAATREEVLQKLPKSAERIQQIFSSHADPRLYEIRGVAMFGISECMRSERCMALLESDSYETLGNVMKTSHDGDRLTDKNISDKKLESFAQQELDPATVPGDYGCSTAQIDALCDMLNSTPGVLGSSISGAGLGGCVLVLVEKDKACAVLDKLNTEYYRKINAPMGAYLFVPSSGARVIF